MTKHIFLTMLVCFMTFAEASEIERQAFERLHSLLTDAMTCQSGIETCSNYRLGELADELNEAVDQYKLAREASMQALKCEMGRK